MIQYPDNHPRATEIKKAKSEVDALYLELGRYEDNSREHYKFAMENLKAMGKDHLEIHTILKEVARKLELLKGLIDSPLI